MKQFSSINHTCNEPPRSERVSIQKAEVSGSFNNHEQAPLHKCNQLTGEPKKTIVVSGNHFGSFGGGVSHATRHP